MSRSKWSRQDPCDTEWLSVQFYLREITEEKLKNLIIDKMQGRSFFELDNVMDEIINEEIEFKIFPMEGKKDELRSDGVNEPGK